MFVQTGLETLIEKKITWSIDHFNYFNGEIERFINQEFEVELNEALRENVPRTKWRFDIRTTPSVPEYDRYGGRTNSQKSVVFNYTPLNAGITRTEVGTTFYIIKAWIFNSDGISAWKSFQTDRKDLMDPQFDGTPILIATLCNNSNLTGLPVQPNGSLLVKITIDICRKRSSDKEGTRPPPAPTNTPQETTFEFGQFLNSEEHSDVKIIAKDGKELHAHKIILRARCDVFDAMFKSDMVESKTGVIKLDDISSKGVNFLLHYLYNHDILPFTVNGNIVGGKTSKKSGDAAKAAEGDPIDVEEVLYIASKYGLTVIQRFVESNLRRLCDEENALYLLGVSKKYSLDCLNVIKAFIKSRDSIIDELMSQLSQ